MAKNTSNKNVVELSLPTFKIAKNGLDEEQVFSFINELNSERDTLLECQERLSSLTKLTEQRMIEADELAKQIKVEAIDQAKAEANAIIAKIKEQVQQMTEEKRAEIIATANNEAEAIIANAHQQQKVLGEEIVKSIQTELRHTKHQLFVELLSLLESIKQQATGSEQEFEHKLHLLSEEITKKPSEKRITSAVAPKIEQNSENIDSIPTEAQDKIQQTEQVDTTEPREKVPISVDDDERADYEVAVELEVLPPINMNKVEAIATYLKGLPDVRAAEVIPIADNTLIEVFLHKPINMLEMLASLPQVGEVKEVTGDEVGATNDTTSDTGKLIVIQIHLSENSA